MRGMAPPRILIVDDQRDITRMLRIAMEALGRGYQVSDVPSAEEALLEIRRAPVDVDHHARPMTGAILDPCLGFAVRQGEANEGGA